MATTGAERQLIIVVEATEVLETFWESIRSDYLDKIIRSFCANDSTSQNPSAPGANLSVVLFFNRRGPYSEISLVQRSDWTRDINVFFKRLSEIPFGDTVLHYVAIAEGLAEALMMFSPVGQRHCILVAASDSYLSPTRVYLPKLQNAEQGDNMESRTYSCLSDAEGVAKSFAQCSISLSVICPWQLPKLKAIYNAGKRNAQAMDLPLDNLKDPNFLVLISENFMEARAALCRSETITMVPTPGMSQVVQPGMQPLGVNNNPATNMPMSRQTSSTLQSAQSEYVSEDEVESKE